MDSLNGLKAEKKLVILLYFSNDPSSTDPNLKPQNLKKTYKHPNVFSFMGGTNGLHSKSLWQQDQETLVLEYITK